MSATPVLEELEALTVIDVPEGLIGLPEATRFSLTRWGGGGSPYALLQATDVESLEFVVVPPELFFPHYAPVVDDELVEALELTGADDAIVLVIVTVTEPVEHSTANLLGPIVINRRTHRAAQAVLSPDDHDPRCRLLAGEPADP